VSEEGKSGQPLIPDIGSNVGGIDIIHDKPFEDAVTEYLQKHLPVKVYNAHFHITRNIDTSTKESIKAGIKAWQDGPAETSDPYEEYKSFIDSYFGSGRMESGLVLPMTGFAGLYKDPDFIADENDYNIRIARKHGLNAALLVTPRCDQKEVERILEHEPNVTALKTYWSYSETEDLYESDLLDYAPEWIWQTANVYHLPVIVHLSHTGDQLSDWRNIEQITMVSEKYPQAKIVLAHSATGYNSLKNRRGLEQIRGLDNIWFDCSGAPETVATFNCMKLFGTDRMMWGDDYMYSTFHGRCRGLGGNYIGLTSEEMDMSNLYPDYKFRPMQNVLESVMALFEACDMLDLTEKDIEKVFYQNGKILYRTRQQ